MRLLAPITSLEAPAGTGYGNHLRSIAPVVERVHLSTPDVTGGPTKNRSPARQESDLT
jgi:hypothetical protein